MAEEWRCDARLAWVQRHCSGTGLSGTARGDNLAVGSGASRALQHSKAPLENA